MSHEVPTAEMRCNQLKSFQNINKKHEDEIKTLALTRWWRWRKRIVCIIRDGFNKLGVLICRGKRITKT